MRRKREPAGRLSPPVQPSRAWRLAWIALLLLLGATLIRLDWPASLTDEDDYMPYALADLAHGRNPYETTHAESYPLWRPWDQRPVAWSTTYPYLPLLAPLQLPHVDYRWTALAAYGLLLLALRPRTLPYYAFANPLILWLAASGFNDFVPLALLAWSTRTRVRWLEWVAVACKQFVLPLVAVDCLLRRDGKRLATSALLGALFAAPLALLDPHAFLASAVEAHASKAGDLASHWNYYLYPLFALAVMLPAALAAGKRPARDADEVSQDPT